MENIIISTDASADLTKERIDKLGIIQMGVFFAVGVDEFNSVESEISMKDICAKLKEGEDILAGEISEDIAYEYLKDYSSVCNMIHISSSSMLGDTCENFKKACAKLNKQGTQNKCVIIDSNCSASGLALLTILVSEKSKEDITFEELCAYAEKMKNKICYTFTIESTKYLEKTGFFAKIGRKIKNVFAFKPILNFRINGKIICEERVESEDVLEKMVDKLKQSYDQNFKTIVISNVDCKAEAEKLAMLIKVETGIEAQIVDSGIVTTTHSGPGTLTLAYTTR